MDTKDELQKNLFTIWYLMGEQRRHGRDGRLRDRGFDPNRGRGRILALLKYSDGISTKEIAHILDIRVSSLNETLARLESLGLIERKPSEKDKRVMLVYLTEEGKNFELDSPDDIDLFKGFSEDELDTMLDYTKRIIHNAEDAFDPEFLTQMLNRWQDQEEMINRIHQAHSRGRGHTHRHPMPNFGGFRGPFHQRFHGDRGAKDPYEQVSTHTHIKNCKTCTVRDCANCTK